MSAQVSFTSPHTAVVTGAAQGIGLEIARSLGRAGARVVIADINDVALDAAVRTLGDEGLTAVGVVCDVTSESDMQNLAHRAQTDFGSIESWVNNAGITRDASMQKMTLDDFRLVMEVHLVGCWLGTRTATGVMREQKRGSVINISSLSGKAGNAGQTNYSAAKAGIVGLTKAAAKEVAHHGVRVNAIQPGLIRTAMTEAMPVEIFEAREKDIPMRRAGRPDEVASAALFLASDLSSYMTGTVLEVAGGRLM